MIPAIYESISHQHAHMQVELMRFPDRTTSLGKMIDSYLSCGMELTDQAIHLLFVANRWEKSKEMLEKLNSGVSLVVDRYSFSGMAYSLSKNKPGLNMAWCKAPEAGLPSPDLVLYMRVNPEEAAKRGGYGEERYEKAEFQKRVASNFDALNDGWVVVDASRSIEEIQRQIKTVAEELMGSGRLDEPVAQMYPTLAAQNSPEGDAQVILKVQTAEGKGFSQVPRVCAAQAASEQASN